MKRRFPGPIANTIGGILALLAFASFILDAVRKVQTGHGLDYYFTGWGVQFNYIGGLIAFALALFALVVGCGIHWWQKYRGTNE